MQEKKMHVVVADDSKMFCESLAALLEKLPGIHHVYKAYDGKETLDLFSKYHIDVALLDVRMPVMDGLEAAEVILKDYPSTKIIGMTSFDEETTLLDLLHVGVHGILLKRSANMAEVSLAIAEVMAGRNYFNAEIRELIDRNINRLSGSSRSKFTPRELEVLYLTCEGIAAKGIAVKLDIGTATVEDYRKEMLRKTNTKNVAELVAFAHRNGLV